MIADWSKHTPTHVYTLSKHIVLATVSNNRYVDQHNKILENSHNALHDNEAECPGGTSWLLYGCIGKSKK